MGLGPVIMTACEGSFDGIESDDKICLTCRRPVVVDYEGTFPWAHERPDWYAMGVRDAALAE